MRGEGVPHDCVEFRVLGRSRVTTHYLPGIGVFRQHELLRILREHPPTQGQHRTEPGPVWLKLVCGLDAQELLYLDVRLLHSNIFCPTFFDKTSNRLKKNTRNARKQIRERKREFVNYRAPATVYKIAKTKRQFKSGSKESRHLRHADFISTGSRVIREFAIECPS